VISRAPADTAENGLILRLWIRGFERYRHWRPSKKLRD
jgi:hypothetical protein